MVVHVVYSLLQADIITGTILLRIYNNYGAVAPKTATNPMAEIHALHGIAAIVF